MKAHKTTIGYVLDYLLRIPFSKRSIQYNICYFKNYQRKSQEVGMFLLKFKRTNNPLLLNKDRPPSCVLATNLH